jgi:divalent metal cation (Fe/Co/Zn/Cd) transporter
MAISPEHKLYRTALWLSILTVLYNIVEGLVSVFFSIQDETLALFGFGIDSFIETVSAAGVTFMILRIMKDPVGPRAPFETTALRITGNGFYVLAAGLVLSAGYNIYTGHSPETTFWGTVVALISIVAMSVLIRLKMNVGKRLGSRPIIADARCTQVCLVMSVVLLAASLLYSLTGIGYMDSLGTLGIAYLSFKEGREALEKAKNTSSCCCSCCGHDEDEEKASEKQ